MEARSGNHWTPGRMRILRRVSRLPLGSAGSPGKPEHSCSPPIEAPTGPGSALQSPAIWAAFTPPTPSMSPFGTRPITSAMKLPMVAPPGSKPLTNNRARNFAGAVLSPKANSRRGEAKMKTPRFPKSAVSCCAVATAAIALAGAASFVPDFHAGKKNAAQEKDSSRNTAADLSTTLTDQTDLAVTVYNSNIALVRDVRELQLPRGNFRLKFMDIAATVNPATVHFRSLTEPDKVGVLEQNYEYDLLEPAKLLNKYVGKEVTLVRSYMDNGTTKHEEIKATLLANNNGPVWKIGNDIVTGGYSESYRFPEVPANLYERPTLLMSLENSGSHKQQIETSYLAGSLSWNSDYVLTITRDDKAADLDGWVTLINNSGTGFHNARLQLVAGDLNRIQAGAGMRDMNAAVPMAKAM